MTTIMTEAQLEHYREHTWVLLPGVVPEDALALARTVLERWSAQQIARWLQTGLIDRDYADEPFQTRLLRAWEAAGRPKYARSPRRDLVSPELFALLSHPRLVDVAQDVFGRPEIRMHSIFNARPKLPDQLWTDTPWHQDAQYWPEEASCEVLTLWIPLQPVGEHNSCLQVASGHHDLFALHDDVTGFIGLTPEDAARIEGTSVAMQPGDVLCFNQLTLHRALPNRSDQVRWSIDIRFEDAATRSQRGSAQGGIARSVQDPSSVVGYEKWLGVWDEIPEGAY